MFVILLFFHLQLGLSPLLFCEDDADEKGKESNIATEQSQQQEKDGLYKPHKSRLCSLQKGPLGFGFNLGHVPHRPGAFISQVGTNY